jgi:proline iminopeptidase
MEKIYSVTTGNIKTRVAVQGEGMPVLLCHGGPGFYDYLKPVATMIEKNAMVIRYDQRGCGRSEKKPPYDIKTYISDIEEIRKYFNIDKWVLGGHSWGANLTIPYIMEYPDNIIGLIYISGTGIKIDWKETHGLNMLRKISGKELRRMHELKNILKSSPSRELKEIDDEYYSILFKTDLYDSNSNIREKLEYPINFEVNTLVWNDWERFVHTTDFNELGKLNIPGLIIHGEGDPRPYRIVKGLTELLQGSEFKLLKKTGHYPWIEEPDLIKKELNEFIKKIISY